MPNPLGWGPKGRWFKSQSPRLPKARVEAGFRGSQRRRPRASGTEGHASLSGRRRYRLHGPALQRDLGGSPTDLLTAMAAGFGAQAIVQWAALQAFKSL